MKYPYAVVAVCIGFLIMNPTVVEAVLPPDLIVSVGSQLVQFAAIFGILGASLVSTLVLFYRQVIALTIRFRYSLAIVGSVGILSLISLYVIEQQTILLANQAVQLEQAERSIGYLSQTLASSSSLKQLEDYLAYCNTYGDRVKAAPVSPCVPGKKFVSDTVTIYAKTPTGPLVIELDANRLEKVPGVYSQYYFLNAYIDGASHADYQESLATTSVIIPKGFLAAFTRTPAPDLSTRAAYTIVLSIAGEMYTITIGNVTGDFITRDTPDYTRFQSVATATVVVGGIRYPANALVEAIHSDEYATKIFFPERESASIKTHQFILWDDQDTFYLFDDSKIDRFIDNYRAHTWLLYKNALNQTLKKSFTGSFDGSLTPAGTQQWNLSFPDFSAATVKLVTTHQFKTEPGRARAVVSGTISDTAGTRTITGILHLVE